MCIAFGLALRARLTASDGSGTIGHSYVSTSHSDLAAARATDAGVPLSSPHAQGSASSHLLSLAQVPLLDSHEFDRLVGR